MPRKRKPSRAFRHDQAAEPRETAASAKWWQRKFESAIAAGSLPVVVRRTEIRNTIGFLFARAETKWPVSVRSIHAT